MSYLDTPEKRLGQAREDYLLDNNATNLRANCKELLHFTRYSNGTSATIDGVCQIQLKTGKFGSSMDFKTIKQFGEHNNTLILSKGCDRALGVTFDATIWVYFGSLQQIWVYQYNKCKIINANFKIHETLKVKIELSTNAILLKIPVVLPSHLLSINDFIKYELIDKEQREMYEFTNS